MRARGVCLEHWLSDQDVQGANRQNQTSSILNDLQCIVGTVSQEPGTAATWNAQFGENIRELHTQCIANSNKHGGYLILSIKRSYTHAPWVCTLRTLYILGDHINTLHKHMNRFVKSRNLTFT